MDEIDSIGSSRLEGGSGGEIVYWRKHQIYSTVLVWLVSYLIKLSCFRIVTLHSQLSLRWTPLRTALSVHFREVSVLKWVQLQRNKWNSVGISETDNLECNGQGYLRVWGGRRNSFRMIDHQFLWHKKLLKDASQLHWSGILCCCL